MKTYVKQLLLKLAFVAFSLFLLFNLNLGIHKKSLSVKQGFPIQLAIPAINIDTRIQYLGIAFKGEMETPSNTSDAGWFKFGPRPGEKGSAVITGHLNGENGEMGVFANLGKLKKGDKLYTKDDKGISTIFVVRESRIYDPGYAENVFSQNKGAHLNLITCDGVWDGARKSYSKRLVVFADLQNSQ